MKKLINLLAIVTLASTSVSNVNTIINNNLNQQSISKINDVLLPNSSEVIGYTGDIKNYKIDLFGNAFFTTDNSIYKVNVGSTNAIEITDIGNGKFNNFKFDSKDNLYFTNESNLFIFDSQKHHYQLTDFKGNTDYVFFTFDNENNLYFGIKNNNETIDLYKQLYDEQKLIKIDDDVQNYEFTWKEQDNINFDNENNLYYVKKIIMNS